MIDVAINLIIMKHITKFAFLFSLAALCYIGCSSGGGPSETPTTDPNKVTIKSGDTATFYTTRRDSNDVNQVAKGDTIYQHVISTNMSAYGKTGVTALLNVRKSGGTDTTFIIQETNGNVWRSNYGVDLLNNDPLIQGFLGKRVDVGWV